MNVDITHIIFSEHEEFWSDNPPAIIKVCHCEQCRAIRDKRKNRKGKRIFKRLMNKRRRMEKHNGTITYHYWA